VLKINVSILDFTYIYGSIYTDKSAAPVICTVYRGQFYNMNLPNSKLTLIDNEGHFSLIRNHLEEILTELKTTIDKT